MSEGVEQRRERLLGDLDPAGRRGLEIGPLHKPLVRKHDGDVLYVDYAATDELRSAQFDPAVPLDDIVDVDIVWGERPLAELVGQPVDYVIASHVIEHVPDLIGWLAELRAVLKPGGVLGLAIPDKRFSFDRHRQDTVVADVVEAHLLGARRPSVRQVFDVASMGVEADAAALWRQPASERAEPPLANLKSAYWLARGLVEQPRYVDAHCWVFTPASFATVLLQLHALGLLSFRIDSFEPTPVGEAEFFVRLVPDDREQAVRPSIERALVLAATAPAPGGEEEIPTPSPTTGPAPALAAELAQARERIAAMAGSKSWRLTAPLRGLRRLVARR